MGINHETYTVYISPSFPEFFEQTHKKREGKCVESKHFHFGKPSTVFEKLNCILKYHHNDDSHRLSWFCEHTEDSKINKKKFNLFSFCSQREYFGLLYVMSLKNVCNWFLVEYIFFVFFSFRNWSCNCFTQKEWVEDYDYKRQAQISHIQDEDYKLNFNYKSS